MGVLVIDDSDPVRRIITQMLKLDGFTPVYEVDRAEKGLGLLGLAPSSENQLDVEDVEVVLLDIMMPELDGIETCRRIRSSPRWADIPILMVTAVDEAHGLEKAFEAGATDYVQKPVSRIELRARMRAALRVCREIRTRKLHERRLEQLNAQLTSANAQLDKLVNLDGLTGLANRRRFDAALLDELKRTSRAQELSAPTLPTTLILADIDHFKRFNDRYGHKEGDECLRRVAGAFQSRLKRPADLAARYGGEEFAVILPATPLEGGVRMAEAIRAAVEALAVPHDASETAPHVTASLGVAVTMGGSPEALIEAADRALYEAKRGGRNRVCSGQGLDAAAS